MTESHEIIAVEAVAIAAPVSRQVHPVVAAMMAGSPTPETLRELLKVQREWEADEARKAFTRAMVALKRDLPAVIARDATVDFTGAKGRTHYTHATLAGAMAAVSDVLASHGFSVGWIPSTDDRMVRVTCRLTHAEGHCEEATLSSPPDTSGSKGQAQAVASTVTLLQRYTLLALLGIATADMHDPGPREPDPGSVDPKRNLEIAAIVRKRGLSVAAAEEHVGRRVKDWTGADLAKLRAWVTSQSAASEPGKEG